MAGMRELDKQDRPREKLLAKGAAALTSAELLQVIVGSGVQGADVVSISKKILALLEARSGKLDLAELTKIKGVSVATASKLIASLELTDRFVKIGTVVSKPEDAVSLVQDIRSKAQEHFVVLTLDGAKRLIERRIITVGTLGASLVHPREVFADAITDRAADIIVIHNHPSGTLVASKADIDVTQRLQEAGELLGIKLIDHIIVTKDSFISIV